MQPVGDIGRALTQDPSHGRRLETALTSQKTSWVFKILYVKYKGLRAWDVAQC